MTNIIKGVVVKAAGVGALALLLPFSAFASSAWSTVEVVQSQEAQNHWVNLNQSASVSSSTKLDGQASAEAVSNGSQTTSTINHASQQQYLAAQSGLEWASTGCHTGCTNATASTVAEVDQKSTGNNGEGYYNSTNTGSIWEKSQIGNVVSQNDGHATQQILQDDSHQSQVIQGQTHVDGFVNPMFGAFSGCGTGSCTSSFGGQLLQTVQVTVQNLLNF